MTEGDVDFFEPIIAQAARRVAYKMDAWNELEDIEQEMWLACCEDATLSSRSRTVIHRRLGGVGANYVLKQKNLGMVLDLLPTPVALASPVDRELVEWALPQLEQTHRDIIRWAFDHSDMKELINTQTAIGNRGQALVRSYIPPDERTLKEDLKGAFRALSEVVVIYEH